MPNHGTNSNGDGPRLWDVIAGFETAEDVERFLKLLLSRNEIEKSLARWEVFKLLHIGTTHIEVCRQLGVAPATVSRAKRSIYESEKLLEEILGEN